MSIIDKLNKAADKLNTANQTINNKIDSLVNPVNEKTSTYNSTGQNVFNSVQTGLNTIDRINSLPSNTVNNITSTFNSLTSGATSLFNSATNTTNNVLSGSSYTGIMSSLFGSNNSSSGSSGTYATSVASGIMSNNYNSSQSSANYNKFIQFEPAPHWLYDVEVTPPGGLKTVISGLTIGLFVDSINIPIPSISSVKRRYQGRECNFPGRVSVDSFSMTILESKDFEVTNFFKTWQSLICNDNAEYALPKDYKGSITITPKDINGVDKYEILMENVYPEKVGGLEFNSNNDMIKIQVTMACDWVSLKNGGISYS